MSFQISGLIVNSLETTAATKQVTLESRTFVAGDKVAAARAVLQ